MGSTGVLPEAVPSLYLSFESTMEISMAFVGARIFAR